MENIKEIQLNIGSETITINNVGDSIKLVFYFESGNTREVQISQPHFKEIIAWAIFKPSEHKIYGK